MINFNKFSFFNGILVGIIFTTILSTNNAFAETISKNVEIVYDNIKIFVDGAKIDPKDANGNQVEAFTLDGTTYLPVRAIAEALGKDVKWDEENKSVYLGNNGNIDLKNKGQETKYSQYTNKRFTFTVKYPSEWTIGEESLNGDGVKLYYGSNNLVSTYGGLCVFTEDEIINMDKTGLTNISESTLETDQGKKALLIKGNKDEKYIEHYIIFSNNCHFDIYLEATKDFEEKNEETLQDMIKSLNIIR